MRRRLLTLLVAWSLSPVARAQGVAQTWLRDALTPPTPGIHKTPSTAIYPPQTVPLEFSHETHMKAGVECVSCHDMVDKSRNAVDRNIPAHPQCEACHDIEAAKHGEKTDPAANCDYCHPGMKNEKDVPINVFPANNIQFSHQAHIDRGAKCEDCHSGVPQTGVATRLNLPRMTTCLVCHDGQKAPNRCSECHLTEPDGTLRTRFASGVLAPSGTLRDDDHGGDFLKRHAFAAQQDAEACNACHRVTECESCHASTSKAFRYHPPDWLQSHGVSARAENMQCTACHREQSFCLSCHVRSGVGFATAPGLGGPVTNPAAQTFHPPGFASPVRTGPNHHSFEAMANPESCVGCHDEKSCMACHATVATTPATTGHPIGTDPHPPGWARSAVACRALELAPFGCAKCHGGGSNLTMLKAQLIGCR
jgi:hypothetical protein